MKTYIELPSRWLFYLRELPETGMGYQIVDVVLHNGEKYNQVVVVEGRIVEIKHFDEIPFSTEEIREVILTHGK